MTRASTEPKPSLELGRALFAHRQALGWSLNHTGDLVGVSHSYINDVEWARRTINPNRLRQVAQVFQCSHEETRRLFILAGYLPPAVAKRFQDVPDCWDVDPGRVYAAVLKVLKSNADKRTGPIADLRAAMTPVAW